jgi:radical SAM protein with 4Fe4S-binding SPASM domain
VIESIKLLVNEKKKRGSGNLFIQIQFVVMKHNEHEILKIKKMATEIGVDKLLFKSVGVQTAEEAREFLPDNPEYRRYELEGDSLIWKSSQNLATNECASLWESTVINWDGSVTPCCYDFNGEYTLGNVFSDGGFRRVWNNGRYRDFRARILSKRRSIPLCAICPGSPGDGEYFLEIEIIN